MDNFLNSKSKDAILINDKKEFSLGIGPIPELLFDNTDRNRTSPFAFTGNRFEFRAVGSTANPASAMISLCSALAYEMKLFYEEVEDLAKKTDVQDALYQTICRYIKESKPIRFGGNGYSEEWQEEAEARGLNTDVHVPRLFESYTSEQSLKLFEEMKVFKASELMARNEVKWEIFVKKVQIESRVLGDLCVNHIAPVVTKYQTMLLDNVSKLKASFDEASFEELADENLQLIKQISYHQTRMQRLVKEMTKARKRANALENLKERSYAYYEEVLPYLKQIRKHSDKLERIVDDELWPLPKYRELLFI